MNRWGRVGICEVRTEIYYSMLPARWSMPAML
jgi:hypothetical protein